MYVYWKPLLFLGLLFYVILFSTDVLRRQKIFESLVPEPPPIYASTRKTAEIEKTVQSTEIAESSEENLSFNFGLPMVLANLFLFLFSLIFCSIAKLFASFIFRGSTRTRKPLIYSGNETFIEDQEPLTEQAITLRASESAIGEKKLVRTESSCPNLTARTNSQTHKTSQTILYTHLYQKQDETLRAECAKLRLELLSIHSNSIKEHALLSRRLESVSKEKREVSKRLAIVQKENQVAKTQLEEFMNEKKMLQKRLDSATREFRANTKTKKEALARLEEISATVNDLKIQLEQVTRDKEILQGKLEVLSNEYEQMQERLRIMHLKETARKREEKKTEGLDVDKAERDFEKINGKLSGEQSTNNSSQSSLNQNVSKESVFIPYVISQTEVDMKTIQMKIFQLEQSLKELSSNGDSGTDLKEAMKAEMDLDKSKSKSSEDIQKLEENSTEISTPRPYTPSSEASCPRTYDEIKVQMLRSALREKIKILENIKERGDEFSTAVGRPEPVNCEEEFEMSSEEYSPPSRIVSNSEAFQRFLKNIGAETKMMPIGDSKFNE